MTSVTCTRCGKYTACGASIATGGTLCLPCWDGTNDDLYGPVRPAAANGARPSEFVSSEPPSLRADESNFGPKLRFRTARELVSTVPEEIPWVVCPWVAEGAITEVSGKVKAAGKTTFVAAMVRAVVTGTKFMNETTATGPVVYLTEQGDTSFSLALARAGLGDRDDVHILSWRDTRRTNWAHVVAYAVEKAAGVGAVLLVVDTLPQFAGLAGDAENNAGAALGAMVPLQSAAADGLAVVVVRHDRKSGGDVGDSARGSSAFGGAVDIVLSVRRADGNRPNARVIHALSRFDETPPAVVVELRRPVSSGLDESPDEYVMVGEEAVLTTEIVTAAVLEHLPDNETDAVTGSALVEAAGGKRTTVWEVLTRLHETGQVHRVGGGKKGDPYRWWAPEFVSSALRDEGSDETNSDHPVCVVCGSGHVYLHRFDDDAPLCQPCAQDAGGAR